MTPSGAAFAEREYNLRAAFPDHPQWFARWADDSERSRASMRVVRDVRYGQGPKQTVDLCPAEHPRGALLFIHGGYWRALDKDDHSFIAPPFVAEGIGVAVVNYDLCPRVRIAQIVEECRQAVDWLTREGESHGVPAQRLIVGGHSAGGHLTAMMLATDWKARGTSADAIVGAVSISGVFDLEPLVDVSFNSDLGLDLQSARELSPIHLDPRVDAPLLLAAGADETSEFIRQSHGLWQSWPHCRPAASDGPLLVPGKHHFSVLTEFADPQSELFAATMALFDSA
ncbi:MAG TPA: alpha/beta hydrolase [Casimicrobiaceae bacterium]